MSRRSLTAKQREELWFNPEQMIRSARSWAMRWRRRLTPIRRYVVRVRHEWAIFYIDESNGCFCCQSSYGNYAHIWTHIGDRTLKEFLSGLNFDYFMGKTRPKYRSFDHERTCNDLKEKVRTARREGLIDKDMARAAYVDIDELSSDSADVFANDMYGAEAIVEVFHGDFFDLIRESPDGNSRGFWETIWPEFLKQIGGRCR